MVRHQLSRSPISSSLTEDLEAIRSDLELLLANSDVRELERVLDVVAESSKEIGRASSGSWLGYQSRVYYAGLVPAPPGAHFSSEWGHGGGHTGTWQEYDFDFVQTEVLHRAGVDGLDESRALRDRLSQAFDQKRDEILSVVHTMQLEVNDAFIEDIRKRIEALVLPTASTFVRALTPSGSFFSRDYLAVGQGVQSPPHIALLAEVIAIRTAIVHCRDLSDLALKTLSHFERLRRQFIRSERVGTKVFIGHGRSDAWKELRDFLRDRLRLPWDEFNRVPVAGVTNVARLSEMLDAAAISLIVMTAEDEQPDGMVRARENVVHEAGLFQGRLGFTRAIVLVEEGCEEFSNIQGLGQVRFSPGQIRTTFEELRRVMEREGIIPEG